MKTLLIDLENGYKSIGSKELIEEKFGLPVLNFNEFSSFRDFISQIWTRKKIEKEVAESVHRMQFPPTIKMMGDRYISGEPVTPEEEVLMGQKWKKQRPRD